MAGPSLAGVASRIDQLLASPDYTGQATDLQGYLHESIVSPGAYLVPGAMYSADGSHGSSAIGEAFGQHQDVLDTVTTRKLMAAISRIRNSAISRARSPSLKLI